MRGQPKLKIYYTELTSDALVVRGVHGGAQGEEAFLRPADRPMLQLLDGTRDFRRIFDDLFTAHGTASLKRVLFVLHELSRAGLLEPGFEMNPDTERSILPIRFKRAWWHKSLWSRYLADEVPCPVRNRKVFYILSIACLLPAFSVFTVYWSELDFSSFLRIDTSYAWSLPYAALIILFLTAFKCGLSLLLNGLLMGRLRSVVVWMRGLIPCLSASTSAVYALGNRTTVLTFSVATAFSYLSAAGFCLILFPGHLWTTDLAALALLLTFIDLDPYREGDLTKLAQRFFKGDDIRHLIPYLKSRGIFSALYSKGAGEDEKRYAVYSLATVIWTIGFFLFTEALAVSNSGKWMAAIKAGGLFERISVVTIMIFIVVAFFVLFLDLLSTLAQNVVHPLADGLMKMRKAARSKLIADYSKEKLFSTLSGIPLFADLPKSVLEYLVEKGQVMAFRKSAPLIIQGMLGEEMFVILDGEVEVSNREPSGLKVHVTDLGPRSVIGEIALIKHVARTADVIAKGKVIAFSLGSAQFAAILKHEAVTVPDASRRLSEKIAVGSSLASSALFRDLPSETIDVFVRRGAIVEAPEKSTIILQGEHDESFFVVVRGKLRVEVNGRQVSTLKEGDCFGEIALLKREPRTASVITERDSLLLRLDSGAFWDAMSTHSGLALRMETLADQRRRSTI